MDTSPDHLPPSAHMRVRSNNNNSGETNIQYIHTIGSNRKGTSLTVKDLIATVFP